MFETLGDLALSAVVSVSTHLAEAGDKAAKGAAGAVGDRLLKWFKAKLDDPVERGALEKMEADPWSQGARKMLEGALQERLEKDQALVAELTALLKELGAGDQSVTQKMNQSGDGNVGTQIAGSGNQVNVTRRD